MLKWIIEGARKVIEKKYRIELPQKVMDAIQTYKDNDWFSYFLEECCEVGDYTAKSGEVYNQYRAFCIQKGEYIRSTTDFYSTLDQEGFNRCKTNKGSIISGFRLKSEFLQ